MQTAEIIISMESESELDSELAAAFSGVNYNARTGATCPNCGKPNVPRTRTMPWDGNMRVRYHKCVCLSIFKSIEKC